MRTVDSLNLKKQRVLTRVDFNVPLRQNRVADDFRIRAALPTIKRCLKKGASVILMSHLGRPGGHRVAQQSLVPVGEVLSDLLEKPIKFSDDCISDESISVSKNLAPGEIHLLENLRFDSGETENDAAFSEKLSRHGTVYVNDAFGTAHRAHASNVGVVDYFQEKAIGLLMEKEYRYLHDVLIEPKRPLVIVLGGAKIGTKLALINRFLREADAIVLGGGMAFTFLRAKGYSTGKSLIEEDLIITAGSILSKAEKLKVPLHLPVDFVVAPEIESDHPSGTRKISDLKDEEMGVDIGSETILMFRQIIDGSATVVWNGPMGVFESVEFRKGTAEVARSVSDLMKRGGLSVIGGGDTAAAVKLMDLEEAMSHISTGGGASLELLAGKDLPALTALETE